METLNKRDQKLAVIMIILASLFIGFMAVASNL